MSTDKTPGEAERTAHEQIVRRPVQIAGVTIQPVSYTHLTLPTICSV